METIEVIGYILDDKIQEGVKAYWAEHQDEYLKLTNEKAELIKIIGEIEARAEKVNADAEINPLEEKLKVLKKQKKEVGAKELADLNEILENLRQERSNISFFKFGLRKQYAEKIEEAECKVYEKRAEINSEQNKIQKQINVWPSVPKIIPEKLLGSAYALIFWVQNIGLGFVPLLIGWMLNEYCIVGERVVDGQVFKQYDYTIPMIVFACFGIIALLLAFALKKEDKRKGYGLELPNIK